MIPENILPNENTEGRFVLTLGLKYNKPIERHLDKMFRAANRLYNALVAEKRQDLDKLKNTEEWKDNEEAVKLLYKTAKEEDRSLTKDEERDKKALYKKRTDMLNEAGFRKYDFSERIKKHRAQFGWIVWGKKSTVKSNLINSQMMKYIATNQVWSKFEKYLYKNGKNLHFRKLKDCRTLTCPTNTQGIIFDGKFIKLATRGNTSEKSAENKKRINAGKRKNKLASENGHGNEHYGEFVIPVKFTDSKYERKALENWEENICYCTIVRIPWKKGWLYKLQITLKGNPPKRKNGTALGQGCVGIDIGPRTIAAVGDNEAKLVELAPKANKCEKELEKVKQKCDRLQRLSNPEMYNEKGEIVRGDILAKEHPECVKVVEKLDGSKKYIRQWKMSNNYKRLRNRERYLYAKCARIRKCQHQELSNKMLSMGDEFYIEPMNWQKLVEKEKGVDNGMKGMRKSVGNRAPATLTNDLEKKVKALGGIYQKVDSFSCKASQYNHVTKEYHKPALEDRVKQVGDHCVQRDLYSAFLLQNVNGHLDDYRQDALESKFDNFLKMQCDVMMSLPEHCPSSMGKEEFLKAQ